MKEHIWRDYDSLHRGCLRDISSGRVVRCRHDAPMLNILGSTSVWASYMIFFGFHDIKSICIMFQKSIRIIKETLVVSDFVLAQRCLKKVFDCP